MSIRVAQAHIRKHGDAVAALQDLRRLEPQLVLVFGAVSSLVETGLADVLAEALPNAVRVGCTTAGEITATGVVDDSSVVTALRFESTCVRETSTDLHGMEDSHAAGMRLAEPLRDSGLKAVMVFGQGVGINGSALLEGMVEVLGGEVPITGGLAGDGGAFRQTWTLSRHGISDCALVAIGFYGSDLEFGHGSFGGWAPFGPARKVTRCKDNILYELDGSPALDIYKRYLGEYARDLPASGLLFPFAMLGRDQSAAGLIRTILGIDEANGSLILAGNIDPEGYLKLMHASSEGLLDGSHAAAEAAFKMMAHPGQGLAILISCVGRKLVLGGQVDEEIEAVAKVLGRDTPLTGFYSYGEISPFTPGIECRLHNQTMTITCLAEAARS